MDHVKKILVVLTSRYILKGIGCKQTVVLRVCKNVHYICTVLKCALHNYVVCSEASVVHGICLQCCSCSVKREQQ